MKFENTETWGFEHAIRGMRNPLESWENSDSTYFTGEEMGEFDKECVFGIGEKDLDLMQKLIHAGSEHRKFMRQIMVSVDITAPLYWWKEFDTYKVGTVANSTSTMHKLASTPITMDCFEMDDLENGNYFNLDTNKDCADTISDIWLYLIERLETMRKKYNETKDKRYWKELIRLLPESWLQKRTITMNYENILNMIRQRQNHKLVEWSESFINWSRSLPYARELLYGT